MDDWQEIGIRVVGLTRKLVTTPSVVDTDGEAEIAGVLEDYLREHSAGLDHVEIKSAAVEKPTACRAVMAHARPRIETKRTLLLMGHIDTVGLEPYGPLAPVAYDSSALKAHFAASDNPEIAAAAASRDWAFGRGWLDMKGGVAAITEVFLHETRRRELPAHLLLLLTPDEESASRGLRALVPELIKLKEQQGLEFAHVINADYISPLSQGDESRYLYSGVIGKMLIGLSVFGRTTHAGDPFGGVNAGTLAGFLASGLEQTPKLMAHAGSEWLPPPTVLHARDRRARYDVMTVDNAQVYLNLFHLAPEPRAWWGKLLNEVRKHVKRYDREMRRRYQRCASRFDERPQRYTTTPEVIDYATLLTRAAEHVDDLEVLLAGLRDAAAERHSDERERALSIIRGLQAQLPPGRPLVVVSLLPPFYPAQQNEPDEAQTARLIDVCRQHGLKHRRVYPYISDMSYFAFGLDSHLNAWAEQSPLWFTADEIKAYETVAARVCNIGPWGSGAHTAEERVHLPYLRDTLPRLIMEALYHLADA